MKNAKKKPELPATPTLDKLKGVSKESQAIGSFLDWLQNEKKIQLMLYHEHNDSCIEEGCEDLDDDDEDKYSCRLEDELFPNHRSIEQLLADYFEIDLKEVEKERCILLDWQRELNDR